MFRTRGVQNLGQGMDSDVFFRELAGLQHPKTAGEVCVVRAAR